VWSYVLLGRTPAWLPWLRPLVLAVGLAVALAVVVLPRVLSFAPPLRIVLPIAAVVAALAVPAAYSLQTASTAHTGAIPSAGPAGASSGFGGPGGGFRGGGFGNAGAPPTEFSPPAGGVAGTGGGQPAGGFGRAGGGRPFGGAGGLGGLLDSTAPSSALVKALQANAAGYTWVAATVRANNAAGLQLATGDPVMAIGGFNGTDPSPTLAQFQAYVAAGQIHYFIDGGGGPGGGGAGSASASAISTWVQQNFSAKTIGGMTVYDLTAKN
jgi:hypothetical protein